MHIRADHSGKFMRSATCLQVLLLFDDKDLAQLKGADRILDDVNTLKQLGLKS
jgi:hypothetical protein